MKISPEALTKLADLSSGLIALVDEWKGEMGAEDAPPEAETTAEEKAKHPNTRRYLKEDGDWAYVPMSATSFSDIDAASQVLQASEKARDLSRQYGTLLENILFNEQVSPKIPAVEKLTQEFTSRLAVAIGEALNPPPPIESAPHPSSNLAESGAVWFVESADSATPPSTRDPLTLDVQLIRPGWGNARDKNFYPRDVLARDAKVFEGAKMYATDHVDAEKSVRTEVSRVDRIVGFSASGAPIARVKVFDPAFAEAVRNRQKAGLLETLECSILAQGRTRPGEVEGRAGNIVESITAAHSVDWVTKAGAGGKALRLAESQTPPPTTELAEADVKAVLEQTKLPPVSRAKVAAQKHATLADLTAAVTAEMAYLKEATGSGKPVNGFNAPAQVSVNLSEVQKTQDAINKKFLL